MSDTRHFEAFMRAYQNLVYSTAARLLGASEAEDVAQEVFLKAYERFDDLAHSPTAGGWLRTVARNLCLNHLARYRARWSFFSELAAADDAADFMHELPAGDTLEEGREAQDRRQALEAALQKLPTHQRVPLVLYHFEELSYEEIARQLGVSLGKVKTDIHRGRLALRRVLEREYESS